MKLQTEHIKVFVDNAKSIGSASKFLSIFDYVRITCAEGRGQLLKCNLNSFVSYDFDTNETCDMLVLESTLSVFSLSSASFVEIIHEDVEKGVKCTISDSDKRLSFTMPTSTNVDLYPNYEKSKTEWQELSGNSIKQISIASKFISTPSNGMNPNFTMLWVSGNIIWSTLMHQLYRFNSPEHMPDCILSKEFCAAVCKFKSVEIGISNRYSIVKKGGLKIGFLQPNMDTTTPVTFCRIMLEPTEFSFRFDKNQIIEYCATVDQFTSVLDVHLCSMKTDRGTLHLSYLASEYGESCDMQFEYEGDSVLSEFPFIFDTKYMLHALNSIPYNKITMYCEKEKPALFTSTEDNNFSLLFTNRQ